MDLRSRYRRDFTTQPARPRPSAQPVHPAPAFTDPPAAPAPLARQQAPRPAVRKKSVKKRRFFLVSGVLVLAVIIVGLIWRLAGASSSPVPASIRSGAGFPVYYPQQSKLPPGYTLDTGSFRRASGGVIVYSINSSDDQNLSVTEEAQPPSNIIDTFIKNYIPLHSSLTTGLGQAQIGAYGQKPNFHAVASLPINQGPWLIITAPPDIKQSVLKQIVESLKP